MKTLDIFFETTHQQLRGDKQNVAQNDQITPSLLSFRHACIRNPSAFLRVTGRIWSWLSGSGLKQR